ncbi:MAG TPA: hypothetical protein VG944_16680 [Fimbriimonas sp.]|nr:hypothetical protein [Fimbriimonas sp.]
MCSCRFLGLSIAIALCGSAMCLQGCDDRSRPPIDSSQPDATSSSRPKANVGSETSPTLSFDLTPENPNLDPTTLQVYDCTYESEGKVAKFKIKFKENHHAKGEFTTAAGQGRFVSVAGSDDSALMDDLANVLSSNTKPKRTQKVSELLFDMAIMGESQSKDPNGGFTSTPPGDWIYAKVVLPRFGDDGEMYMNLDPVKGKGEFSIKDAKYGSYLIEQLETVL